jgi:ATP dependent DNA ligase domain
MRISASRPYFAATPAIGPNTRRGVSPDWLHEVKYDGYRLRLERDGDRVRLITRGGYNWTDRYRWIVEAALKNRQKRFVIEVYSPSGGEHPLGGSPEHGRQCGRMPDDRPSAAVDHLHRRPLPKCKKATLNWRRLVR